MGMFKFKNTLGNDVYEWVPADENFSVTKADLMLQENKYKCVALYNDDIVYQERLHCIIKVLPLWLLSLVMVNNSILIWGKQF